MIQMLEQLYYELFYLLVLCLFFLSIAIAELAYVIGIGDFRLIPAVIGTAGGFVVLLISPSLIIAAFIVSGVVTIGSNLLISYAIAPKIQSGIDYGIDKILDKAFKDSDGAKPKGTARDHNYILYSDDAAERIKYLKRYMWLWRMRYTFSSNALTVFQVFTALNDALEASGVRQYYPESVITSDAGKTQGGAQMYYWIKVALTRADIVFEVGELEGAACAQLRLSSLNEDNLKLGERMDLETYAATALDWLYIIARHTLYSMDNYVSIRI